MENEKITTHDIILRHLGDTVHIILIQDDELTAKSGKLMEVEANYVVIKSEALYKESTTIEFKDKSLKKIIHFYNSAFVDLLTGKETKTLATKLRKSEDQKSIISSLKPFLGSELAFVYKQNDIVALSTGKFLDMGVRGIQLRIAPFYNSDITLTYDKILHIYDDTLVDLTKLAPRLIQ